MVACAPTEKLLVLHLILQCKNLEKDAVNHRGMTGNPVCAPAMPRVLVCTLQDRANQSVNAIRERHLF